MLKLKRRLAALVLGASLFAAGLAAPVTAHALRPPGGSIPYNIESDRTVDGVRYVTFSFWYQFERYTCSAEVSSTQTVLDCGF